MCLTVERYCPACGTYAGDRVREIVPCPPSRLTGQCSTPETREGKVLRKDMATWCCTDETCCYSRDQEQEWEETRSGILRGMGISDGAPVPPPPSPPTPRRPAPAVARRPPPPPSSLRAIATASTAAPVSAAPTAAPVSAATSAQPGPSRTKLAGSSRHSGPDLTRFVGFCGSGPCTAADYPLLPTKSTRVPESNKNAFKPKDHPALYRHIKQLHAANKAAGAGSWRNGENELLFILKETLRFRIGVSMSTEKIYVSHHHLPPTHRSGSYLTLVIIPCTVANRGHSKRRTSTLRTARIERRMTPQI